MVQATEVVTDAQHLATELMGGMSDHDRKPIPQ